MADFSQDINRVYSFSMFLNGTWKNVNSEENICIFVTLLLWVILKITVYSLPIFFLKTILPTMFAKEMEFIL